jgi:uncharacterized membrane protein
MHFQHFQYFPVTYPFFAILVAMFIFLVVLIQVRALNYAYMRLGISSRGAMLLLLGSLLGSYFNIPVAVLPEQQVLSGQEVDAFGIRYLVPVVVDWPGTVVALNAGGAIIPGFMSFYLLAKNRLWVLGSVAVICVAAVCHMLARPIPGIGIALPVFAPASVTAIVALLLSRKQAAPLAYIGGSLGVLVGADLLNLNKLADIGAPIMSIGGAGTFDGIFVTGVLAVLLASFAGSDNKT